MKHTNQQKAIELFKEKDALKHALTQAEKHNDWKTNIKVSSTMSQIESFDFDYQDVNKLILPMVIHKIKTRINEINKELNEL